MTNKTIFFLLLLFVSVCFGSWTFQTAPGAVGRAVVMRKSQQILIVSGVVSGSPFGMNAAGGLYDNFVAAFSTTNGSMIWVRQFGTTGNDQNTEVALDHGIDERIFLNCHLGNTVKSFNVETGVEINSRTLTGDYANVILPDGLGNVYIATYDSPGAGRSSIQLTKYTRDLVTNLISKTIDPSSTSTEWPYALIFDSQQHLLLVGTTDEAFSGFTNQGQEDCFVMRLFDNSTVQWVSQFGGSWKDFPYFIHEQNNGELVVAGTTQSTNMAIEGDRDLFVATLDGSNGTVKMIHAQGVSITLSKTYIALDPSGQSLFFSGRTDVGAWPNYENRGSSDAFVAQLSISGDALIDVVQWGSTGLDYSSGCVVDNSSNVFTAGYAGASMPGATGFTGNLIVSRTFTNCPPGTQTGAVYAIPDENAAVQCLSCPIATFTNVSREPLW
eukprot:TRINITY_DN4744_c0_g2_i1.p1 TRINITY_DN4744_c0_g2~~TRINITY_DN4744_c0_g2_i1.p1  ORF type:complete len:441 (+),score=97.81 TRINITY_DN4744_c0_g2_i1:1-1323(+)